MNASNCHTRTQQSEYGLPSISTKDQYYAKKYADEDRIAAQQLARGQEIRHQLEIERAQNQNIRGYYDGCSECGVAESQGATFTTIKNGDVCDGCL